MTVTNPSVSRVDSERPVASDIRVCHVVDSVGETTGPANHATALAKHTDIDVGLLAWFDAEPFDEDHLIEVHELGAPDTFLGIDRSSFQRACSIVREYDILHTHHLRSGTLAKLIGAASGKGLVFTSGTHHFAFDRIGRVANGLTNAFADRLTCVSPPVRESRTRWERLLGDGDRVRVVYTGVDVEKIRRSRSNAWSLHEECNIPPDAVVVGHAGRLVESKAQDVLIEATGIAAEELQDDLALVIAGDGPRADSLEALVREKGLEDTVHFAGLLARQQVYSMMRSVDIFAMPSRWEGFSSAAIEAMALKTPCVLSDIPSFREPFDGTAVFHDLGDPRALAEALVDLAAEESKRREYGRRGYELVMDRFRMEQTAHEYAALYEEIADREDRRAPLKKVYS